MAKGIIGRDRRDIAIDVAMRTARKTRAQVQGKRISDEIVPLSKQTVAVADAPIFSGSAAFLSRENIKNL